MLTAEQKALIEDSFWVVNDILKKRGLGYDNDLRQAGLLYMCQCVQRFDASRGVKWSTYAYKSVSRYIKRIVERENRNKARLKSADEEVVEESSIEDFEYCDFSAVLSFCTAREQNIIKLLCLGYKGKEIAVQLDCSSATVSAEIKKIKEKIKSIKE